MKICETAGICKKEPCLHRQAHEETKSCGFNCYDGRYTYGFGHVIDTGKCIEITEPKLLEEGAMRRKEKVLISKASELYVLLKRPSKGTQDTQIVNQKLGELKEALVDCDPALKPVLP